MTKLSIEAIIAIVGVLIALPPIIIAYLQWHNRGRRHVRFRELPTHSTEVPMPRFHDEFHQLDVLIIRGALALDRQVRRE
ncbi:hypothetical protein CGCF413_v010066 [Colletotrichum fructicola]|nr:hypothetical protein CGCF413_v010066 [Colletotrichum fructicola]